MLTGRARPDTRAEALAGSRPPVLATEDLLLLVALAGGFALGHWHRMPRRGLWATRASILLLVGSLGVYLSGEGPISPLGVLLPSLAVAAALVGGTVLLVRVLARKRSRDPRPARGKLNRSSWLFPPAILTSLLLGYALGSFVPSLRPGGPPGIEVFLFVLLFLVGWDAHVDLHALKQVPLPLAGAILGSLLATPLLFLLTGEAWNVSLATTFAFSWYTLAGPAVSQAVSPTAGLIAFLVNFLREDLTMLSAPWLGAFAGAEGIAACGGAASMDTTLYFVTTYGRRDAATLGLAVGTVLTLLAPVLLSLLLSGV